MPKGEIVGIKLFAISDNTLFTVQTKFSRLTKNLVLTEFGQLIKYSVLTE